MEKWIDSQAGKLKVDETGNIIARHTFKYYSVANKIIKVTLNPDGTEGDAEFFKPRNILLVHPKSGEIMGHHCGFIEDAELNGIQSIKVEGQDGVESVAIEIQDIPADFMQEGIIAYTHDGTQFVPLPAAELARRIELKKQPERI